MSIDVIEVDPDELPRWLAITNSVRKLANEPQMVDWRRQAEDMAWLIATTDGVDVGAGLGLVGWHSPPGIGRAEAFVPIEHRGRGVGTTLVAALSAWAARRGCVALDTEIEEDDPDSLAWAERRGYREVGRNSTLVLDLTAIEAPAVEPPDGIEIVIWADRPELAHGMYEVALEAYPDVPGHEEEAPLDFDWWMSNDMSGEADSPAATFVALAGNEVVGYAKLALTEDDPIAYHDMTGVLRAWRGRGIAGALKRAEIAWAKNAGYEGLRTQNETRNDPIRRLNEHHGYVVEPGYVTMRASIALAD